MTTAGVTDNTDGRIQRGDADATPLDYGSGHVRPARAFDPGLVYDSGAHDWARYACGIGQLQVVSDWCPIVGTIDPSDLNYPSIAIGSLPGEQTVTRTVTNVGKQPSVYAATVSSPPGTTVTVTPSTISVGPGKSATFKVTVTRTSAPFREWTFGSMTWTDLRGHTVRSPIGVRPVALTGPGEITGAGPAGRGTIDLRAGYSGTVTARAYGPAPSTVHTRKLVGSTAAFLPGAPGVSPSIFTFEVRVPPGTKLARVSTFAADHAPGTDLDLYVYDGTTLIDRSDGTTADEEIPLTTAGVFEVYVVQFGLPADVAEQEVKAHLFLVGASAPANLSVTPASAPASPDETVSFDVSWSALSPARRYLGMVEFTDGKVARAWTTVAIGP
ncbi:hypothetical protein Dfulv_46535 [Dactylosporangium fulvum]|uniref:Subtilisin-like protease fibronectin type-III domain-containing protein n=2 Tax=Dactylosporangium fulvum TaxID=53359 RepID=A0ABY5WE97_9ACTN|nr:hypothetical protein Dfulv_46535 [Dactylosporangium fulvum]